MQDSGERRQFASGAVRDRGAFKPRPDLISPHANQREGAWLALGAEKYQPRNWEKGIPISECVASLARHLEMYKLGQRDEDHMAAIRTNAGFILHFEEEIKAGRLPVDLDDMPHYPERVTEPVDLTLERRVQVKLAETFEDDHAVYVGEDIPAGATFAITRDGARPDPAGKFYAVEDLPRGVPITIHRHMGEERCDLQEAIRTARPGTVIPVAMEDIPDLRAMCDGLDIAYTPKSEATSAAPRVGIDFARPGGDFTVYLCGPITGQKIDYLWREAAAKFLAQFGIKTLNPLRGKQPEDVGNLGLSYKGQLAAPEIAERDRLDIEEADVILAHFPYTPSRQSIGSLMEMGAAAIGFKKPVLFCTDQPVFNDHLFVRNFCILEPNFEQALHRITAMAQVKVR